MKDVSVVIPCYNAERYIAGSIDSVIEQGIVQEIICVDDGSSDGTRAVLEMYHSKYPGIVRVIAQENKGAGSARNTGWKSATGKYIQFLDADDRLVKGKLTHQVNLMNTQGTDLIAGAYRRISGTEHEEIIQVDPDPWTGLIRGRLGCTCSNLFRRTALENCGGWNESLKSSQETDLMFRMLKTKASVYIDQQPLTIVHVRDAGSISAADPTGNLERYLHLRHEMNDYLRTHDLLDTNRKNNLSAIILGTLSMLFRRDRKKAVRLYRELFRGVLKPVSLAPVGKTKSILYRIIGFALTERLFLLRRK